MRLVAGKELLEALRDRRTLFVALVLPVLLYPMIMLVVAPLVSAQRQRLQQEVQPVAVSGDGRDAVIELVLSPPENDDPESDDAPRVGLEVVDTEDPEKALRSGEVTLWIEADDDFRDAVDRDGTGTLVVRRDASTDDSQVAYRKWLDAVAMAEERIVAARFEARNLDAAFRNPIDATVEDVATAESRTGYVFGKVLALLLVVMTLSSSFYPAVDCVAGEKERGTMETLLVAPCGRAELVLGKFVAVLAVTLAAAVLNLASIGLTMGPLVSGLNVAGLEGLSVTPGVLAAILALLIPLASLFSAMSLALSTMARSVKEAQHYMTPLFLLVMPLAMVVVIPNIPLSPSLAAVPITNVVLFFRDLMVGRTELFTGAIVLGSTVAAAGLALWASMQLFLQEETLFRGPEGAGPLFARPIPRETPRAGGAVLLFTVSLALVWYAQGLLPPDQPLAAVLIMQFGFVLAPCLLLAWWLRARIVSTFQLLRPPALATLLAIPIGLAAPVVNAALHRFVVGEGPATGPFKELEQQFTELFAAWPWWVLVLAIGVLPGVIEELTFRGFLLSGFRASFRGRTATIRAVVITAALFAVFHIYPEKWLTTGLMGLVLGLICVRSRSLWPAAIAHALNNGSLVLIAKLPEGAAPLVLYEPEAAGHGMAVAGAAVVLALSLGGLVLATRRQTP